MPDAEQILQFLGRVVVFAPALLFALLGLATLFSRPLSERMVGRVAGTLMTLGLVCSLIILGLMLTTGLRRVPIVIGSWVHIPHYHFAIKFEFDRLSVPFAILSFLLCGTIGAFAFKYMHRERGYNRFFVLYGMFVLGIVTASLAGTIETLFAGWELVGLSSALLVAFYHERPGPVRNGLRIWSVYRISDAALLFASVAMHHVKGEGDFDTLMSMELWPDGHTTISSSQILLIGSLLLLAAAGKSALVPFSNWLPRAMEGPTPSSAVFYGALSVHLGAFLLLRVAPLLDASITLSVMVTAVGLSTAIYAAFAGRVQTDIKSALSFASLTQVGLIVGEIGVTGFFGIPWLRYIPLIHLLGHACLRTMQFIRAPTLLHDYQVMENAIGDRLPRLVGFTAGLLPVAMKNRLYRLALERGHLDDLLNQLIVGPFLRLLRMFDRWERGWTDWLSGQKHRDVERFDPNAGPLDDVP